MMKKILCMAMVTLLMISLSATSLAANIDATVIGRTEEKVISSATVADDFAEDRILVIMTNAVSLTGREYGPSDFPEISCNSVIDLMPSATARANAKVNGVEIVSLYAKTDGAVVTSDFYDIDLQDFRQILCLTLTEPGKENVIEAVRTLEARSDIYYVGPDYALGTCAAASNETYTGNQWVLDKLQISQAWDVVAKTSTVYVGVVDTGIDTTHPDLSGIVYPGKFQTYTNTPANTDLTGHGTAVAGTVGLITDEIYDISDNCWNIKVVSLKAKNYPDFGNIGAMISAVCNADDLGIPILNVSVGFESTVPDDRTTLAQAIQNYSGLVVCAAGNSGYDLDNAANGVFPAKFTEYDNLITVGASTSGDQVSSFSNYGATTVDIFAPGEGILCCYPTDKCDNYSDIGNHFGYGYHYKSGSSFASPMVAGIAALMLVEDPTLTASEIKDAIMNTADQRNAFDGKCVSGGSVNAYAAIMHIHTHIYQYTSTPSTHTGTCSCGAATGTSLHIWGVDLDGTSVCRTCGYYRATQIESLPDTDD